MSGPGQTISKMPAGCIHKHTLNPVTFRSAESEGLVNQLNGDED